MNGHLSVRAIKWVLEQIGHRHDAEVLDPNRRIAPSRPDALRHTFAIHFAQVTKAYANELEPRLGHRSLRYVQRCINPPEPIAAGYVEKF